MREMNDEKELRHNNLLYSGFNAPLYTTHAVSDLHLEVLRTLVIRLWWLVT